MPDHLAIGQQTHHQFESPKIITAQIALQHEAFPAQPSRIEQVVPSVASLHLPSVARASRQFRSSAVQAA
jgi:hypothetical protein